MVTLGLTRRGTPPRITERDLQLRRAVGSLRFVPAHQLAPLFFGHTTRPKTNLLRRTRALGFPDVTLPIKRITSPAEPLYTSHSGRDADPRQLARQAATRYRNAKVEATTLIHLPGQRKPRPAELAHDAVLSAVFFDQYWPNEDGRFLHEDQMFASDEVRPDAVFLSEDNNSIAHVVEILGVYSARKIERICQYWSAQRLPSELW